MSSGIQTQILGESGSVVGLRLGTLDVNINLRKILRIKARPRVMAHEFWTVCGRYFWPCCGAVGLILVTKP